MTTAVSICSNALVQLGDRPIASFEESATTDRARNAALLWPSVRDFVLRSHPWNCAVRREVLAPLADGSGNVLRPAFDFSYQFLLPSDYLRVIRVGCDGERPRYKVESIQQGRVILLDSPTCLLRFVFRNENVATWDTMLVWAMTEAMRAALAFPTTGSGSMEQMLTQALKEILRQARAVDGQEDDNDAFDDNPLIDARFAGGGFSQYHGF